MARLRPICDRHTNLQMIPCSLKTTTGQAHGDAHAYAYVCPVPGCAMQAKITLPEGSAIPRRPPRATARQRGHPDVSRHSTRPPSRRTKRKA